MKDEISDVEKINRLTDEPPIFVSEYELLDDEFFSYELEFYRMCDAFFETFNSDDFLLSDFFDVASAFLRKASHFKNSVSIYVSLEKNYGVVKADMTILDIDRDLIDTLSLGQADLMMLTTMCRNDIKGILIHIGMPLFTEECKKTMFL